MADLPDYSLELFLPIKQGDRKFVQNITKIAKHWRRSIRFQGGYWMGSFRLDDLPLDQLKYWYSNLLGSHIEERSGGVKTWEGFIYEMTLNYKGVTRMLTYDTIYNYVKTTYINNDTPPVVNTSAAAINQASIDRFGRREELLSRDNSDQATAEAMRDIYLLEHAWPHNRPVQGGMIKEAPASLDVTVCGYVFTINFRYTTTADNSTDNVSGWIRDIINTDCTEFIQLGRIDMNGTALTRKSEIPERCWDMIMEIATLTDSQKIFRAYVANERRFQYINLDLTKPQYLIRDGMVMTALGKKGNEANAWQIKPGLFRDMDYSLTRTEYSGLFNDARDFVPDEISVGVDSGFSWSSEEISEAEQIAALQDYESEEMASAKAGDGKGKLNWKRKYGLIEGTPEWDEAVKMGKIAWLEKYRGKGTYRMR